MASHRHTERANVLRDAAGFALCHGRRPQRVQQRRFAVVNVPHDSDHRRAQRTPCAVLLSRLRPREYVKGSLLVRNSHEIVLGSQQLGVLVLEQAVRARITEANIFHAELHHACVSVGHRCTHAC